MPSWSPTDELGYRRDAVFTHPSGLSARAERSVHAQHASAALCAAEI